MTKDTPGTRMNAVLVVVTPESGIETMSIICSTVIFTAALYRGKVVHLCHQCIPHKRHVLESSIDTGMDQLAAEASSGAKQIDSWVK
jgi:hypothetical protein